MLREVLSGDPTVTRLDIPDRCMELELHVTYAPPHIASTPQTGPQGRVQHIVVRLNVLETTLRNFRIGYMLEAMEPALTQLPSLRTVAL